MSDLAARLLAAIGERERLAQEASNHSHDMYGATCEEQVAHIAANDPATVLRACAAHRRIAERHAPVLDGPRVRLCDYCDSEGVATLMTWPCPDWLDVSSIYGIET